MYMYMTQAITYYTKLLYQLHFFQEQPLVE